MQNEELIVLHCNYARVIALSRRCLVNESELDDMISEAQLALVTAGRRFDPNRGASFQTWVGRRVSGAVDDWRTASRTRYGMSGQYGGHDSGVTLPGNPFVGLEAVENTAGENRAVERRVLLEAAMAAIPARLADILRRRFWEGETVESIGVLVGLSQSYVSQLVKRGLWLLRKELALRGVRNLADIL